MKNILYIVIPCYNEQAVLQETAARLKLKLEYLMNSGKISEKSRIVFVNDGSYDNTWIMIKELHERDSIFTGINLSTNKGHQNALLAGLLTVKGLADAVISMDADLQDDIDAIEKMIDKYHEGCDIVYGVRSSRVKDSFFKRFTAESFYKLMSYMGANTVYNHADYRLMSRRAIEDLSEFKEVNLFLRGIVPLIGYRSGIVTYERNKRYAGESKYPLNKMIAFAWDGITSFSIKPIRMISTLGIFVFSFSILMLIYILARYFTGQTVVGWASLTVSLWAIGGLILLSLGIIGEYIGKIFLEAKQRPRFFVESFLDDEFCSGKNEN
ncbi:glycosyltransferase family 2 protein [Anaerocolumna sp. AGMB13025]|uniref:glycosyltransferase family 2 protein n=1 Tax=Anaerocolumna sp. AGMB13025 TaxID=3039116 RepID=UPI00241E014C|nr:glycosyltransferase family 2 protein [Anaerocolumna sp. AGMB13025]WFR55078.1 glycosyltransferase family 2 protein [Anaerocolumna sp. AGMB13025]